MDHIKDTYARMDLPRIRSFLLYGSEDFRENVQPYRETLANSSEAIHKRLEALYPDGKEQDEATGELSDALTTYQNVYMELGMKAGARLVYQLLLSEHQQGAEMGTAPGGDANG